MVEPARLKGEHAEEASLAIVNGLVILAIIISAGIVYYAYSGQPKTNLATPTLPQLPRVNEEDISSKAGDIYDVMTDLIQRLMNFFQDILDQSR